MMRLLQNITLILMTSWMISHQMFGQCVGTEGQVTWIFWQDVPHFGMNHLWAEASYPQGPDQRRVRQTLSTPYNYDDNFGGVVKGFISVPESGDVTFNVTGDDQTLFLMSTDQSAANLDTIAYIEGWTNQEEHNKYSSQTSLPISMMSGQLYYFELQTQDGGGGDHAAVWWQRPYVSDSTWTLITAPYLTDVCDTFCEPIGAPCNDGNPQTSDDVWDGNCNCVGRPSIGALPVGERGKLDAYFYDNLLDDDLDALMTDSDFPAMPDRMSVVMNGLLAQWTSDYSTYGTFIQGYFTVPVTACYDFNITGTNEVMWKLYQGSTLDAPADSIRTRWGTGTLEHDHPSMNGWQTMENVCLTAGTFYYFEMFQANGGWGHRYSVHWKADFYPNDRWHRIPSVLFYDYTDELACLPANAICDDGDPLTANDRIVNNGTDCYCQGTPCDPMNNDCDDPEAYFMKYDYCDINDEISTREDDAWLSCTAADNPYLPARSGYHWIHYDLGDEYFLNETHVWNYNVQGQTNLGFSNVVVDYSIDGIQWYELGSYIWDEATGTSTYNGFVGPDFGGEAARYVLITCLDNPSSCRGISKLTFNATSCPELGNSCDDGDPMTYNDHYLDNCLCQGYTLEELDCMVDTLYINEADIDQNSYHAMKSLVSEGKVMSSGDVHYKAGVDILLSSGFEIEAGGLFEAQLSDCPDPTIQLNDEVATKNLKRKKRPSEILEVYDHSDRTEQTIRFYLPEPTTVSLAIYDQKGNLMYPIVRHQYDDHGEYYKRIQTKRMAPGIYMVQMYTDQNKHVEKMVVL